MRPHNDVWQGDCVELLARVGEATVDLAFADPPFNIGYDYDVYRDKRVKDEYLAWTDRWLSGVRHTLKSTGSLFVAIGDEYAAEVKVRLDALGLTMRNWIVWHYTFGVSCTKKFNRSHAHILYYVVDPKRFTFDPSSVRVPSARQTTYADSRANPLGKLPDDTWVLRPQESPDHFLPDSDTWAVPRVCGTFGERVRRPLDKLAQESEAKPAATLHPCQMPEAVLERILRVASDPGDLVLDPFAGSGTTLAVAKRLRRRYLGMELSEQYTFGVRERLAAVKVEPEPVSTVSVPRTPGVRGKTQAAGLKPR